MNNLDIVIDESCRIVDETLDKLIPSAETEPQRLHEAIRWSLFAGGKRFRPVLLFATGQSFGAPREKLLRIAAAVEMVHTYSLIHDDLPSMDNDDLRRGRETCHKKFGEATAILAGDVLETLAFSAVAEDGTLSADLRIRLVAEIARAAGTPYGMVAGQQLDLEAEGKNISIDALNNIHSLKTGSLIAACGRAGALIGGASEAEVKMVEDFSRELGLLFQITDDILDITQTTASLGKTAGKDISARKATYPSHHGIVETEKLAGEVHLRAIEFLDPLDRPTDLLREIASFVLSRTS
ncbi:MAG: polyprenyl synthetase family protein [Saprospiraceae bacterium]|nr:polyprenyl synthetase family protein [Pyrinomonadaceae bacterium]